MIRIDLQLLFKRRLRLIQMARLPLQISQPKIRFRLLRILLHRFLKLRNRFRRSPKPIQRLPHQNVRLRRIRVLLHDRSKLPLRTCKLLRQQAALRQHLPQLRAVRIRLHHRLQIRNRIRKLLRAVAAQPQQRPRLPAVRIAVTAAVSGPIASSKCPCLNSAIPQFNLNPRHLRRKFRRLAISRNRLAIFVLVRQHKSQVRVRHRILRILPPPPRANPSPPPQNSPAAAPPSPASPPHSAPRGWRQVQRDTTNALHRSREAHACYRQWKSASPSVSKHVVLAESPGNSSFRCPIRPSVAISRALRSPSIKLPSHFASINGSNNSVPTKQKRGGIFSRRAFTSFDSRSAHCPGANLSPRPWG